MKRLIGILVLGAAAILQTGCDERTFRLAGFSFGDYFGGYSAPTYYVVDRAPQVVYVDDSYYGDSLVYEEGYYEEGYYEEETFIDDGYVWP